MNSAQQVVVILGVWRSGTSCVAGMLERLGVEFGIPFRPPAPENPKGFFEEARLNAICRRSFAEPMLSQLRDSSQIRADLMHWLASMRTVFPLARLIGAKHPALCAALPDILAAWGGDVRLISVDRDRHSVCTSLRRHNWWPPIDPADIIDQVLRSRELGLQGLRHLRISYDDLL